MAFYAVGGRLVRRTPQRRGMCLEVWSGREWLPYTDVDEVLRHGVHLIDARALDLLRATGEDTHHLSAKQARTMLRAPGKRFGAPS